MRDNKKATFYKVAGGDFGAVRLGRRWVGFGCLHCARVDHPNLFRGPDALRWQGPPSKAIVLAMVGIPAVCRNFEKHQKAMEMDRTSRQARGVR